MSCILCSPEECDVLAARIIAQDIRLVDSAARLATWENYNPLHFASAFYAENLRAFVARYEGRHMEGVTPASTGERDLPEVSDAKDLDKLESSLSFFVYQCSEGACYESPVYRFLRVLQGKIASKLLEQSRGERSSWAIASAPVPGPVRIECTNKITTPKPTRKPRKMSAHLEGLIAKAPKVAKADKPTGFKPAWTEADVNWFW